MVAAASRLGISRPAVAKRVRNLEALARRPLLHRGGRGVRLTPDGAILVASARPLLRERDAVLEKLTEIRGERPSLIAGVRDLVGGVASTTRAAQRVEARLAETERVLELVLRMTSSGVVISDPDTKMVGAANEAFCTLVGLSHHDVVGRVSLETDVWDDQSEREHLVSELERVGHVEGLTVRVRRPDGSLRVARVDSRLIRLAGTLALLSTADDITDEHRLETERTAIGFAHRAVQRFAALLLARRPLTESACAVLPELRDSGDFRSALLWDPRHRAPVAVVGEPPPADLDRHLAETNSAKTNGILRLGSPAAGAPGLAAALPGLGAWLVLISAEPLSRSADALFNGALRDLVELAEAASGPD
jgi:PAS domain S-box-containing protein